MIHTTRAMLDMSISRAPSLHEPTGLISQEMYSAVISDVGDRRVSHRAYALRVDQIYYAATLTSMAPGGTVPPPS